ncbi:MAG TPA: isoprenylcysteine carboxylmethyltransferase family protein [Terracidiphilus sp.]|nr:isoprenylcysteine carboxylmethyltransferase family protein [Terracidiphilus sp.]
MAISTEGVINFAWITTGLVWLIGLAFTKRTVRAQPAGPRVFYVLIAASGFFLIAKHNFDLGWLGARIAPASHQVEWTGAAVTMLGCLFAIWARITLGANWSGRATVKKNHELIQRGPYSLARHPIYTGLLTAIAGTALANGVAACLVGLVLIVLAFFIKMSQEERLMQETFPEAYPAYRRRVKALIPGVF